MCRLIVLAVTRSIIVVGPEGGQVAVLPLFLPKRDPKVKPKTPFPRRVLFHNQVLMALDCRKDLPSQE